jgi:hydrogenase expression/formation protein HypD
MGVGFETTSPTIAATIISAKKQNIRNFFVLSNFKVVFPALAAIASSDKIMVDGFICPGHVSVITGSGPYEDIARRYKKPCVITGFEDADIIKGINRLVRQMESHSYKVEIEYKRAVAKEGNKRAREVLYSVFKTADSSWRGLGDIRKSGLKIRPAYKEFDADLEFRIRLPKTVIIKGCACGEVLQGIKTPNECLLFKKACTPRNPIGPCMVSSEGTCAAYFKYSL